MTGDAGAASHPSEAARPGGGGWNSRSTPVGPAGLAGSGLSSSETPPRGCSQADAIADGTRSSGKQLAGGVAQRARESRYNNHDTQQTILLSAGAGRLDNQTVTTQKAGGAGAVPEQAAGVRVGAQIATGPMRDGGAEAQPAIESGQMTASATGSRQAERTAQRPSIRRLWAASVAAAAADAAAEAASAASCVMGAIDTLMPWVSTPAWVIADASVDWDTVCRAGMHCPLPDMP